MKALSLVAIGGALGAVARYSLSTWILHHTLTHKFPYGTFAINVIGCFFAGLFVGYSDKSGTISPDTRIFLLTGLLGGFTTFSAFGLETFHLLRRGDTLIAATYILFSMLCGLCVLAMAYQGMTWKK